MLFNGRLTRVSADDCSRIVSQLTGSSDSSYSRYSMSIARYTFSISFSFCTGEFVSWNKDIKCLLDNINDQGNFHQVCVFIIRRWNKAQSVIKLRVSYARFSWTLYFFFTVSIQPHNTFDVFLSLASFFQEQPPVTPWRQTYVSKCNPSLSIFPRQPL